VIREAAFQKDEVFLAALAQAQKMKIRVKRRDLIHIYMDLLFLLQMVGHELPKLYELQRLLDPTGRIFPGFYAFERDLQRRRDRFNRIFLEMESESSTILDFYGVSSSPQS
jgi:hypothetical protein